MIRIFTLQLAKWIQNPSQRAALSVCTGYLFGVFGRAGAVASGVAGSERAGRRFVRAADHRLAAVERRRTHLGIHWQHVLGKVLHGVGHGIRVGCMAW